MSCLYQCRFAVIVAICLAGIGLATAQEPASKPQPSRRPAASAEQVAAWIRGLDADEFFIRETAMLSLLDAGPPVLPALKPVLTAGSLEATSRALFIVRRIGLTADIDTQDQAGRLLAELAGRMEAPALARRAAAALEELTHERSARALSELEALGAKTMRGQVAGGIVFDEPAVWLEIGEAFRGEEHDLRRLKWLVDVPVLILNGKQVTDGWIKQAAAMPGVQELHIFHSSITNEGLAPLADHTALRQVGIYYVKIGEAALQPLTKMPLLSYVKLYGTQVTQEQSEEFKATSGLGVDRRRGAFLGIGSHAPDGTCLISTIHKGSPADKAGLLEDDIIIRFGGSRVSDFNSLMELISVRDADEEVDVEVARRMIDDQGNLSLRTIQTKVKLAPWDVEAAVRNPRR